MQMFCHSLLLFIRKLIHVLLCYSRIDCPEKERLVTDEFVTKITDLCAVNCSLGFCFDSDDAIYEYSITGIAEPN